MAFFMSTLAKRLLKFHQDLELNLKLPAGVEVMNPYQDDPVAIRSLKAFLEKFYSDNLPRHVILGINPGRFGSGITGVAFTDTKRLKNECGISYSGPDSHEPSSVFIYEMINAFGGVKAFYEKIYINSICPLGFTILNKHGRKVNYNYYDEPALLKAVTPFMTENVRKLISAGMETGKAFCFGTGKNAAIIRRLNDKEGFFKEIIPLEHPRYIMQYKSAVKEEYIRKYLDAFSGL